MMFNTRSKILTSNIVAPESFFLLEALLNTGKSINFSQWRGKKILIVNTASDCGFTDQYEDLQNLQNKYKNQLHVIGFPANDFGEQEKAGDETIATFCKINYGVTFPLVKKSVVKKITGQHEVYKWLTDKKRNGWNDQAPSWNFCKYLIDEKGNLSCYFESAIEPFSKKITEAIEKIQKDNESM